jgi:predicted Rossmann fold nucleotide-binding protein DprA/Smf involved in DNA uptake
MRGESMLKQGSQLEMSSVQTVFKKDKVYPASLRGRLGKCSPDSIYVVGDTSVLKQAAVAFVCSVQCPGSVVIHTFDAIRNLRDAGVTVIGGFHAPMEQECLDFLLRGKQPVIMSLPKGLSRPKLTPAQRRAVEDGRMVLVSIFPETITRTNKRQSQARNEFIAALASSVLIPHASLGGNAESIARQVVGRAQPLFTIQDPENDKLIQLGAQPFKLEAIL